MGNCFKRHGSQYEMQNEAENHANDQSVFSAQSAVIGTLGLASAQSPVPEVSELDSTNAEEYRANEQVVNSAQSVVTGTLELAHENSNQDHDYASDQNLHQSTVSGTVDVFPVNENQDHDHASDQNLHQSTVSVDAFPVNENQDHACDQNLYQATVSGTVDVFPVNEGDCHATDQVLSSIKMEVHSAVDQDKTCVEELFESNPYDPKLNQRLCPPYVTDIFHSDKIELIWDSLRPLTDEEAFQVSYRDSNGKWKTVDKTTNKTIMTIRGLKAETSYFFRVRLINDTTGEEGQYSMQSDAILTGKSSALEIKKKSSLLKNSTPPVYQLPIKEDTTARNPSAKTRKFVLGDSQHLPVAEEKTIMIVGATGSGKSTLINAMANYVFGVTWEDCFRFSLVDLEPSEAKRQVDQSHSQTEWVTCYTIYNSSCSRIDYTINLIDTPGFGDTRGLEQDSVIVDQIRELFSLKSCKGVVTLDAVCFLVKAPDSRMTITQRYIFDSILALFGNDIKENICTLITFADGQRPPVIDAIQSIEGVPLPYEHFFTFNNSALFAENEGTTKGSLSPMFWDMGIKSCKTFFDHVTTLNTKSLTLTAEVLNSRHTLQNKIYNLQQEVDEGMSKINTLEEEIEIFTKYKDAIKDNADFEYQVEELQQVKENLEGTGKYTTTCLVCNFTCHKFCKISDDRNKADCIAMKDGKCTQCPDSCAWNHHHNTPYIFKTITVRKRKRYAEKLKKYQEANQQRLSQEQVIANMKQDVETLDYKIQVLVVAISQLNNRLKKIALRSDPKSTVEYIELMIESEKRENRKGFKSRIDALERCKERAKYGIKVEIFQDRLRKSTTFLSTEQIDDAASENNSFWMVLKKFEGK